MLPLITAEQYEQWRQGVSPEQQLLSTGELAQLRGYRLAKRQSEWLTGRLCAKLALQTFLDRPGNKQPPTPLCRLEIVNDPSGRPRIGGPAAANVHNIDLSISHAKEYGLALVADCCCGIDIQRAEQTLVRVQEKFCRETEINRVVRQLPQPDTLQTLNLLWTAKEAAKKAMSRQRMPGFLQLFLDDIAAQDEGYLLTLRHEGEGASSYPPIQVIAGCYREYTLALCLLAELPHA